MSKIEKSMKYCKSYAEKSSLSASAEKILNDFLAIHHRYHQDQDLQLRLPLKRKAQSQRTMESS
jgi:hypothetical protein